MTNRVVCAALMSVRLLSAAAFTSPLASHAVAQTAIPPNSKDFLLSAAQADQYEIQAACDALAQSQDAHIKAFAHQMIEDHTRTDNSLQQAARFSGLLPPPPSLSGDQSMMLSGLQSLRGSQFDRTYIKQQILAHYQALAVERSYADQGTDINLRRAAQATVGIVQHHLEMAQQMRDRLGVR